MGKKIIVASQAAEDIEWQKLKPFQEDLKTLPQENYEKLRDEIELQGFTAPIFVWKEGKILHVLDGHQRLATLRRMSEEDYEIPKKLPVCYIKAKNRKQAEQIVFGLVSQFGVLTNEGVANLAKRAGLELSGVSTRFVLGEIDLDEVEEIARNAGKEIESVVDLNMTADRLEKFQSATIKQIVLYYPWEEFSGIIRKLDDLSSRPKNAADTKKAKELWTSLRGLLNVKNYEEMIEAFDRAVEKFDASDYSEVVKRLVVDATA